MPTPQQSLSHKKEIIYYNEVPEEIITLEQDAELTIVVVATKGWDKKHVLRIECKGQGSRVNFFGFIIGTNKKHFHFETVSNHTAKNTSAHYSIRAALFDESEVDYKGNLIINKEAQLADTYLAHHTLLLSDKAHARTIPALEIEADDVKAGHAATIGRVNKEDLFYLTSRGLESHIAQQMLIQAFFEAQINTIEDDNTRDKIRKELMENLPFAIEI